MANVSGGHTVTYVALLLWPAASAGYCPGTFAGVASLTGLNIPQVGRHPCWLVLGGEYKLNPPPPRSPLEWQVWTHCHQAGALTMATPRVIPNSEIYMLDLDHRSR